MVPLKVFSPQCQGCNLTFILQRCTLKKHFNFSASILDYLLWLQNLTRSKPTSCLGTMETQSHDEFIPQNNILLEHFYIELSSFKPFKICFLIDTVMQLIYRRTNTLLHSSLNRFKVPLKRKIIFLIKAHSHPPPQRTSGLTKGSMHITI